MIRMGFTTDKNYQLDFSWSIVVLFGLLIMIKDIKQRLEIAIFDTRKKHCKTQRHFINKYRKKRYESYTLSNM